MDYEIVVIGAGAGGLVVAIGAAIGLSEKECRGTVYHLSFSVLGLFALLPIILTRVCPFK